MKNIISTIIIFAVLAGGFYFFSWLSSKDDMEGVDFNSNGEEMVFPGQEQKQEAGDQQQTDDFWNQLSAEIIKEGTGAEAKNGDIITAHYTGYLEDGTKFDSSVDRGQPFKFALGAGEVIQGWELGIVGMKVGEIRKLYIPYQFGYGEQGTPGGPIPPNANLIFEIELLDTK